MSPSSDDSDSTDIPLHSREMDRLTVGDPVIVDYRSNRGSKKRKQNSGEITHVQALGSDSYRFWFYDSDAERKIEVTLRSTIGQSRVRSQKTDTWSVLGDPVQVTFSETASSVEDVEQSLVLGKRSDDFDVVLAVAEISTHRSIIQWFAENNCL